MNTVRSLTSKFCSGAAVAALAAVALFALGCASGPPSNPDNLCAIFKERPKWQRAARKAERRWGIAAPVMMAVMHKESSYDKNAKAAAHQASVGDTVEAGVLRLRLRSGHRRRLEGLPGRHQQPLCRSRRLRRRRGLRRLVPEPRASSSRGGGQQCPAPLPGLLLRRRRLPSAAPGRTTPG